MSNLWFASPVIKVKIREDAVVESAMAIALKMNPTKLYRSKRIPIDASETMGRIE
jgi:hypothetical protein